VRATILNVGDRLFAVVGIQVFQSARFSITKCTGGRRETQLFLCAGVENEKKQSPSSFIYVHKILSRYEDVAPLVYIPVVEAILDDWSLRAVLIILLFVVIGVSSPKYDTKMAVWFFFVYHQRFFCLITGVSWVYH